MDVTIVIVNYNTCELLEKCIASIKNETTCLHEIIVVDNASKDESLTMLNIKYSDVIVINNTCNVGFAKANNQGFSIGSGKYYLMLNPDTVILSGAIDKLVAYMDSNQNVGICGPQNVDSEGNLQYSCDYFPGFFKTLWAHTNFVNRYPNVKIFQRSRLRECDYVSKMEVEKIMGCSLMIRSSLYKQLGGLDTRYFMYFEETDLCYRVKQAGSRILYLPDASIVHFGGESAKTVKEERVINNKTVVSYYYKSQCYFFRKNYGLWPMVAISALDFSFGCALLFRNLFRKDKVKKALGLERGVSICSVFIEIFWNFIKNQFTSRQQAAQ
jgi:N-acetylglucosaminyl-diphospho-decaprenol L-rhamnosyltransferase